MTQEPYNGWAVEVSADNGAAAAVAAAPSSSQRHYITGIDLRYSAAVAAVKAHTLAYTPEGQGAPVTLHFPVNHSVEDGHLVFRAPLKCARGTAVTLTAAASGTGGTIGYAKVLGFTA